MSWKEFLKPDLRKIVIFFIIWLGIWLSIFLIKGGLYPEFHFVNDYACDECKMNSYGFPFISLVTGYAIGRIIHQCDCPTEYYLINIIGNILTSYFISCLISWLYDRYRKPKKK